MELGVSLESLEKLGEKDENDSKKMEIVWKMWLDHTIEKYPPTSVGLTDMLKNVHFEKMNFGAELSLKYAQFMSQ